MPTTWTRVLRVSSRSSVIRNNNVWHKCKPIQAGNGRRNGLNEIQKLRTINVEWLESKLFCNKKPKFKKIVKFFISKYVFRTIFIFSDKRRLLTKIENVIEKFKKISDFIQIRFVLMTIYGNMEMYVTHR